MVPLADSVASAWSTVVLVADRSSHNTSKEEKLQCITYMTRNDNFTGRSALY